MSLPVPLTVLAMLAAHAMLLRSSCCAYLHVEVKGGYCRSVRAAQHRLTAAQLLSEVQAMSKMICTVQQHCQFAVQQR